MDITKHVARLLDAELPLHLLLQAYLSLILDVNEQFRGIRALALRQLQTRANVKDRTMSNWLNGHRRPQTRADMEMLAVHLIELARLREFPEISADLRKLKNRLLEAYDKKQEGIDMAAPSGPPPLPIFTGDAEPGDSMRASHGVEEADPQGADSQAPVMEGPGPAALLMSARCELLAAEDPADPTRSGVSGRTIRRHPRFRKLIVPGAVATLVVSLIGWNHAAHGEHTIPAPSQASASSAALIGSFEEPDLSAVKGTLYFPKGPIWRVWGHNGGGFQRNGSGWGGNPAPDGVQTAFMHSGDVHLTRDLQMEPGSYTISFYVARRPYGQDIPNPVQLLVNGKPCTDVVTPRGTSFERHVSREFEIEVPGKYVIEFATRSAESNRGDTFLDRVELHRAPDRKVLNSPFEAFGGVVRTVWGGTAK